MQMTALMIPVIAKLNLYNSEQMILTKYIHTQPLLSQWLIKNLNKMCWLYYHQVTRKRLCFLRNECCHGDLDIMNVAMVIWT